MSHANEMRQEPSSFSPSYISSKTRQAYDRIQSHLYPTNLLNDEVTDLCLKCEHEQKTGSFKWRGALSRLSLLKRGEKVVTASTGNHGLGIATAAKLFGLDAKIFVPATAVKRKIEKLRRSGAEIIQVEGDSLEAELSGKKYALENNLTWVSPYNDVDVIAGQGTIALELSQQLPEMDRIYVTVGGGGLISGIASWIRYYHPQVEIIGCHPVNSAEMYLSTLAGYVVNAPESLPTLSDGSAGPLEEESITFSICQNVVDRFMVVTESEIEDALRHLHRHHQMVVEGSAGVAMAAAMKDNTKHLKGNSVVVLCGGNIDPALHQQICGY